VSAYEQVGERRTFVASAGPETGKLDDGCPITVFADTRNGAVLPRACLHAEQLAGQNLAIHDMDDAFGGIGKGIANGNLRRVRTNRSDSREGDTRAWVQERRKIEVQNKVEEEDVDGEVQEARALQRRWEREEKRTDGSGSL
jgi:hypothetical protein